MYKKIIYSFTIVFLLLFQFKGIAQQYQPTPDSNAIWIILETYDMQYEYQRFYLSEFIDDTMINSKSYIKTYYQNEYYSPIYNGAFRNEDSVTYFINKNSNEETVLRDFTKNQGDTVESVIYGLSNSQRIIIDFIVDSSFIIESEQYTYKTMYLSPVVEDTIPIMENEPLVWMEKIGSFGGGLMNYHSYYGGLNDYWLYCMQHNDTIFYNFYENNGLWDELELNLTYEAGECDYPVGIEEKSESSTTVTPNPFTNTIKIITSKNSKIKQIAIFNSHGNTVFEEQCIGTASYLILNNLQNLDNGLYLLKIQYINNKTETIKLIKNQ